MFPGLELFSNHWCCPVLPLGSFPGKGLVYSMMVNSEKDLRLGRTKVSLWEAKNMSSLLITPSPTV